MYYKEKHLLFLIFFSKDSNNKDVLILEGML
jgi:hypothetical protein